MSELSSSLMASAASSPLAELLPEQRERLSALLDKYLTAHEQGAPLARGQLLADHPDLAEPLQIYFRSLEDLHALAAGCSSKAIASEADAADLAGSPRRLGDFELLAEIGRGGMGVVYRARQLSLDRLVALKVLPFAAVLDPRQVARFKQEAQAAAQLQHPHIVPVFAVGVERGVHYYAMQLVDGQPLDRAIAGLRERRRGRIGRQTLKSFSLPTNRREYMQTVIRLGIQAAEALHAAHESGIVHRDIKPSNLLLDATGNVWVTDFGLARFQRDASLTRTGDLVGTLRYMSPEQAAGRTALVDRRTDVYALGITLYELLALRPAFVEQDAAALSARIEHHEPPRLRSIHPDISVELETVITKAIAKDREHRYSTAQALAADLNCVLNGWPTLARPATALERAARWTRRHRRMTLASLAALAFLSLGLATAMLLVTREKSRAERNEVRAEQYSRDTRAVLDRFGIQLAGRLASLPQAMSASRELLQETREHYERYAANVGANTALLADLALTYGKLAMQIEKFGTADESLTAHQKSAELFQQLVAHDPSNAGYQRQLAMSHNNVGRALARLGKGPAALDCYESAIQRLERLLERTPHDQEALMALSKSLCNRGTLLHERGCTNEAIAQLQKSLGLMHGIRGDDEMDLAALSALASISNALASVYATTEPERGSELFQRTVELLRPASGGRSIDANVLSERAKALMGLASLRSRQGQPVEAARLFEETLAIQRELVCQEPQSAKFTRELAVTENNAGVLYGRMGNWREAAIALRRSIEIQERLVKHPPGDAASQSNLAGAYSNLAMALERTGQIREALANFALAIELQSRALAIEPETKRFSQLLAAHVANQARLSDRLQAGTADLANAP